LTALYKERLEEAKRQGAGKENSGKGQQVKKNITSQNEGAVEEQSGNVLGASNVLLGPSSVLGPAPSMQGDM
jgi:hypothetical protein